MLALVVNPVIAAEPGSGGIQGSWRLNTKLSDSVEQKFSAFEEPVRGGFRAGGIGAGSSGKVGRATGELPLSEFAYRDNDPDRLARTVSMRKVFDAESLVISGTAELTIAYDDITVRRLVLNPHGRIYSASGKELVADEFGHTLSFWEKNVLVIETMTARSVAVTERYRVESRTSRLKVVTTVTPPGGLGIELVRFFDRLPRT